MNKRRGEKENVRESRKTRETRGRGENNKIYDGVFIAFGLNECSLTSGKGINERDSGTISTKFHGATPL
jgi:hypothetical protein